jgi:hypothetical protein
MCTVLQKRNSASIWIHCKEFIDHNIDCTWKENNLVIVRKLRNEAHHRNM